MPENAGQMQVEQAQKRHRGRWLKGQSGNVRGKGKGTRNRATMLKMLTNLYAQAKLKPTGPSDESPRTHEARAFFVVHQQ